MRVALHDHENNKYPNLALMKISAFHKAQGDTVEWFENMGNYDKVYSAKVFTWTRPNPYLPSDTIRGGTGFDLSVKLPSEVDSICPDYSLYSCTKSYGFLTRGCPRSCPWCFVPKKEGSVRANDDIEHFARHREVVLMDNNVLAHEHGIKQLEKIAELELKVDFNQGLDARLIDSHVAKLLANLKWSHPVRLACDSMGQMESILKAVALLRYNNCTPRRYFCYVLVKDIDDALERVKFLKGIYVDPFCQPYRDPEGTEPTQEQKWFARWVNHKAVFNSTTWEEYLSSKSLK